MGDLQQDCLENRAAGAEDDPVRLHEVAICSSQGHIREVAAASKISEGFLCRLTELVPSEAHLLGRHLSTAVDLELDRFGGGRTENMDESENSFIEYHLFLITSSQASALDAITSDQKI